MRRGAAYLAGRGGRGHQPRAQPHCVVDNVKCFTLELLHWRAIHLKWNAIKHFKLKKNSVIQINKSVHCLLTSVSGVDFINEIHQFVMDLLDVMRALSAPVSTRPVTGRDGHGGPRPGPSLPGLSQNLTWGSCFPGTELTTSLQQEASPGTIMWPTMRNLIFRIHTKINSRLALHSIVNTE